MPEIPVELKPRLKAWWETLDDGTHTIFEAIYMEAPAAVSRAISGGQWVADEPEPGLAAQLGGSPDSQPGEAAFGVPAVAAASEIRMSPNVGLATPLSMLWTERNPSSADMPAYYTDVYVENSGGEVIESTRLPNPPLKAGEEAERSFQFSGTDQAGGYTVRIYLNSEGSDPGIGVPGAQGLRSALGGTFTVGLADEAADHQNDQLFSMVVMTLTQAGSAWPPAEAGRGIIEALNWLAGDDTLTDENRDQVARQLQAVENLPYPEENDEKNQEQFRRALAALSGAANGLVNVRHDEGLPRLLRALNDFVMQASVRIGS
jgi:hypothetical protein